jgi:preprotein translocase subunit SecG
MLYNILLIVQIVVSAGIIVLVLMQQGKGADAGAAFGSGASGTVFGSRGSANFLSRTTAVLATVFFLNSISLAFLASGRTVQSISVMDSVKSAPATANKPTVQTSDVPSLPAKEVKPADTTAPASNAAKTSDVPAAPVVAVPANTAAPTVTPQNPEETVQKPVQNPK